MLGGVVATNHCADEITRQALDAQLLNVNRNSGGGVPEASAYPVLVALGILDENDAPNWYVMGGIAIASLALGIVGYRYFSPRLFSKPVQQVAEVAEKIVQKMAA